MVLPQSARGDRLNFRALKSGVFTLEGLNGFATSFYFNYLFFYLRDRFGVSNAGNLLFCACNGFVYTFSSLYAGRFAQRRGYFTSLFVGISGVSIAMILSLLARTPAQLFGAMCLWSFSVCFTWPVLEALSAEKETALTLPRKIGIYNVVWSATQASAYFLGGAIAERFGWRSIFLVPLSLHLIQFIVVAKLARAGKIGLANLPGVPPSDGIANGTHPEQSARNKSFLRMAWLANPFAYIALNTIVPLIPAVAGRFHLTPATAGFFCSVWMFSRLAAFAVLWKWPGWHYRFDWLLASYLLLIATFMIILLAPNFWVLLGAQAVLGWAAGLIYYSSLFYSMDESDSKGEHGGVHEAAIGSGIFLGPAIGFAALHFFPANPNSSAYAVSAFLFVGLAGLLFLRRR